ncbi:MAG: phosphatidylserine decarboxylase [Proteobacteria bacterium]|nr:phosphatidylserine decarboxylase [Pseudomonadota bacterium]
MKALRQTRDALLQQEDINFLLTNRVPRIALTRFMGWFSKIRNPLVRELSIGTWRLFTELDLSEAKKTRFASMHDCFTRELKDGARPVDEDPAVMSSPCDAIVGACGPVAGIEVFQAKGFPYSAAELFGDAKAVEPFRDGTFVTLRLTSSMYHRFHAPHDCTVHEVRYLSGDTWNVNPIALKRVERLFCRNERAVLRTRLASGQPIAIVPVAAILVASMRLHCLDVLLHLRYRGPERMAVNASYRKGQEMGWFEHGSTIIVFAPKGFSLAEGIETGSRVRMGQALMRLPQPGA